jgi:hypothetical protein
VRGWRTLGEARLKKAAAVENFGGRLFSPSGRIEKRAPSDSQLRGLEIWTRPSGKIGGGGKRWGEGRSRWMQNDRVGYKKPEVYLFWTDLRSSTN